MTRSTKKPYHTQGYKSRGSSSKPSSRASSKRAANRAVRALPLGQEPSGGSYKRHYNPWDICDWKFYSPKDKKAHRK